MKVKILVGIVSDCLGGVDSYILNFCRAARENNYAVDLLCRNFNDTVKQTFSNYVDNIYEIPDLKHFWQINNKFSAIHKVNNYDFFYLNASTTFMYKYLKAAKFAGIKKVISHCHSSTIEKSNKFLVSIFGFINVLMRHKVVKFSDAYLACSYDSAVWMYGRHIADTSYVFINVPINVSRCKFNKDIRDKIRNELNLMDNFIVGSTSGFRHVKNVPFTIDVFSEYNKMDKNAKLVLAGDGPLCEEIENYAHEKLDDGSFIFLGPRKDVPDLLSAFDCLLFPSRKEGSPMSLIEAQASDLSCVCSSTMPKESLILNDVINKLDINNNEKQWAEAILKIKTTNRPRSDQRYKLIEQAGFSDNVNNKIFDYFK